MRIEDLECFRTLAETLNYTSAANRLYLTQSSLTRTIQQMEEELGFQLFDRSRRSVSLTAAGQSFYQNCQAVLDAYQTAAAEARSAREGSVGVIRFASHAVFPDTVVYDILGGFQKEHEGIRLQVSSSVTEAMIHDLNEGEIDCAVCTRMSARPNIGRIVLRRYRECLVVSPHHPLAEREEIGFEELKQERFSVIARSQAMRGFNGVRSRAEAAGFDPRVEEDADNVAHLLALVSTGKYVTVLSENYRLLAGNKLRFIPLADESTVDLAFLYDKESANPCVEILAEYIRTHYKRRVGDLV